MDFFESQDRARSLSVRLTILFTLSVLLTIVLVHGLVSSIITILFYSDDMGFGMRNFFFRKLTSPSLFLTDCTLVVLTVFSGMLFKSIQVKIGGNNTILSSLNATTVPRNSTDAQEQRLYNIVEEMSIASGVPVPRVFVIKGVDGINACAVGLSPENAAICVTQGALKRLKRDELQGVVAHEFSHIYHCDMKLNMRLLAILFGIELIVILGTYTIQTAFSVSGDDDSKAKFYTFLFILGIGVSLVCIGWTGILFGNMMRAAVTRQREYLADASAVQFTRNPEGLANALKKIGGVGVETSVDGRGAQQAAHFFFAPVFKAGFMHTLFRTHPPLIKRIKAIDPSFEGVFPTFDASSENETIIRPSNVDASDIALLTDSPCATGDNSLVENDASSVSNTDSIPASSSSSERRSLPQELYGDGCKLEKDGENLLEARIPTPLLPALDEFISSLENARAIVFSVLLDKDSRIKAIQREGLQKRYPSASDNESLEKAISLVEGLSVATRLQVVRICIPLLKTMTPGEYDSFRQATFFLCCVDRRLDVFEYTLQCLAIRELDVFFGLLSPMEVKYNTASSVEDRLVNVLAALASQGALKEGDAELAFEKGCSGLGISAAFPPSESVTLRTFTESLNELAKSSPQLKKLVMEACWRCVLYDEVVTDRELVLISATAAALGIPAPFWQCKKTEDSPA
ncbi:MAG: M48 family metallopeptidase [Thermoguttaceae bacterium]